MQVCVAQGPLYSRRPTRWLRGVDGVQDWQVRCGAGWCGSTPAAPLCAVLASMHGAGHAGGATLMPPCLRLRLRLHVRLTCLDMPSPPLPVLP